MKLKKYRSLVITSSVLASIVLSSAAHAATYYWDNDGTNPGFGTAAGTWAAPTAGDATQGWTTNGNSITLPTASVTTNNTNGTTDAVNFGNGATGLGAGTITVSGTVNSGNMTFASGSGPVVLSGGTITLTAAETITVNNAADTIGSNLAGGATSLTKAGTGTLTLSGANTYSGFTLVNAGTLVVGSGTSGSLNSGSNLRVGGGTFTYARTDAGQTVNGLTVNAGASTINNTATGQTLTLGGITRTGDQFGTINFGNTTGPVSSTFANVNGIAGPWASIGTGTGLRFAVSDGGVSTITGLTGTTATTGSLDNITDATGNFEYSAAATTATDLTGNTLRYSGGASTTNIGATNTLTLNGLMNAGTGLLTVSGGPGTGGILIGSDNELVVTANAQDTAVSAVIADGVSAGSLTYNGAGSTLTLSGANTFTGGVNLNGGILKLGNPGALNSTAGSENAVTVGAGTLTLNGNSVTVRSLGNSNVTVNYPIVENESITPATLTVGNSANAASTYAGLIQNGTGTGALTLAKKGTGTLKLSGTNTYTGGTVISAGRVDAGGNSSALGTNTITFDSSAQLQPFSGGVAGTFRYPQGINIINGATASIGGNGQYWFNGDVTGNGGITASTFNFGSVVFLNGTNNTFTGPIIIGPGGGGSNWYNVQVASLADSPTANGMIQLANGSAYAGSGRTDGFIWTGATNLVLNNRQLVVASTSIPGGSFYNNSTNNSSVTINTTVTGAVGSFVAGPRILSLGGTSTAVNTIAGAIVDGTDVTLAPTITARSWIFSGTNTYSGATTVAAGALFINGNQTSATGAVNVSANATLGGTGTIGGDTTIANTGKLEFNLSTAAGSHDKLELAAGKALTLAGASTLTLTSSGGASAGDYTLVTAPGGFGASVVPVTVNLPLNWTADAPRFDGNDLKINITSTGSGDNYQSWADANGVTGGPNGDSDNDGVPNLVEYALVNGGERGVYSGNTITFTKRGAPYGSELTYIIQTSETLLEGSWTDAVTQSPGDPSAAISYTLTPSTPTKKFARLKIINP